MKSSSDTSLKGGIAEATRQKCSSGQTKLKELIPYLQNELHYDKDRITRRLMELHESGRIDLVEEKPYANLASYAISPLSLWYWAAFASTLLSLALISVTSGVVLYLRYVFGGLLILFLPGFSLIELLYAKRKELDDLTRVALSIGLSLAIVPLTGLVLNYTPFGIRLLPVAISISGLTIILLTLALRRKHSYYKLAHDIT